MQIDTRNRECGVSRTDFEKCMDRFHPGPEPRQARYGLGIPAQGTNYSGLLECPCTSRFGGDACFYPDSQTKILLNQVVYLPYKYKLAECLVRHLTCLPFLSRRGRIEQ